MAIINFTVTYDLLTNESLPTSGEDVGTEALVGYVHFTPQFTDSHAILAQDYSPRPAGLRPRTFTGYLDSDGRLRSERGADDIGVRLWANDPVLELSKLVYKVEFDLTTPMGEKVRVDGGYFEAPSTDTTVNLTNVLTTTGTKIVTAVREQGYAEDIMDSGAVGRDLVRSQDQSDAWSVLGVAPAANLVGTADNLPIESGFWWTSEPAAIGGKVYMGTTAADRGSWVQEWTQTDPDGPFWLHRYFMGFTVVGSLDSSGSTELRDDHNPAQCAVKAGKPLVAFWSGHGSESRIYYRISNQNVDSARPGELTFGPVQIHSTTNNEATSYAQVMINGDDIWVCHRTTLNKWSLTKFPSWATGTPVQYTVFESDYQTYAKARMVDGVIRCIVSDHPNFSSQKKIWYAEINVTTGSVTKADGTVLGNLDGTNLPLDVNSLELVFTSSGSSRPWGYDVGYGSTRQLVFVDAIPASFASTAKYKYARYSAGSWTVSDITDVGSFLGGQYFPSITFVPDNANQVLLARATGTTTGTNYVEKWATANSGASWNVAEVVDSAPVNVTTGVPRQALTRAYPVRVVSGSAPFNVIGTDILWYPTYFRDWVMYVRPLPLSHPVKRVPSDSPRELGLSTEPKSPTVGLYLPGTTSHYIQGPTSSSTVPADGIRLEVDVALPDWTPAADLDLFGKEKDASNREPRMYLSTAGRIGFWWSEDGPTAKFVAPNASVPAQPWQRVQLAVEFLPSIDNPVAPGTQQLIRTFYRFADAEPWTVLAVSQTSPSTSFYTADSPWEIGGRRAGTMGLAAGIYYRATVMTVGGAVLAEWRADRSSDQGVQVDPQGNTWRIKSRDAQITSPVITTLKTTSIVDPTNNINAADFGSTATVANANRLRIRSSDTDPSIQTIGASADIPMLLVTKGDGEVVIQSESNPAKLEGRGPGGAADFDITTQSSGVVKINGQPALFSGGALGTPASGSLINCTGLPVAAVTGFDPAIDTPNALAAGEATFPRELISLGNLSPANGNLRLTYFTARRTETIQNVRTIINVAQSGATLVRVGLYTVDGSGNLTLVASTTNDTTLWKGTGAATKALSASYGKTRGQRYAVGILVVGAGTQPQLSGCGMVPSEAGLAPRLTGFVASQTDLPSSISAGSVADTLQRYYAALVA